MQMLAKLVVFFMNHFSAPFAKVCAAGMFIPVKIFLKRLKQPVTIRLDRDTVAYFKSMAIETGLPYQNLINLYLRDCAVHRRKPSLKWVS